MSKKKTDFDSINKLLGSFNKKQKKEIQEELERETAAQQPTQDTYYDWARYFNTTNATAASTKSTISSSNAYSYIVSNWRHNPVQSQPVAEDYEDVTDD